MNDGFLVTQDPVNWIDPSGLVYGGVGGVIGPFNINWNSSKPNQTNLDFVTDLELGGGIFICFENPFLDDDCKKTPDFLVDFNVGSGKYTGVTFNVNKFCINIGYSRGLTPFDFSIPGIGRPTDLSN